MLLVRPARVGQDDARADRRAGRGRRLRGALRRPRPAGPRSAPCSRAPGSGAGAARDGLLPRRDPPLQQGPAGRAAARRRGGPRHADRRHDREPLLRGQPRAARRGRGSTSSRPSPPPTSALLRRAVERAESPVAVPDEALELLAERSGGDARMALAALELAPRPRADRHARGGRGGAPARRVRYDKGADAHYGTISAWIKPRAAPTSTRPSTTWRR